LKSIGFNKLSVCIRQLSKLDVLVMKLYRTNPSISKRWTSSQLFNSNRLRK